MAFENLEPDPGHAVMVVDGIRSQADPQPDPPLRSDGDLGLRDLAARGRQSDQFPGVDGASVEAEEGGVGPNTLRAGLR